LHWLTSTNKCVEEITTLFPATSWCFCPTSENPADLLTRGITSQQLASSNLWKVGLQWLTNNQSGPPQAATVTIKEVDTTATDTVSKFPPQIPPLFRQLVYTI